MEPDLTTKLNSAVAEANGALSAIQDLIVNKQDPSAIIKFPRRYIRTAYSHEKRLEFIQDDKLRKNLSYALMLSDVYHWLLTRTDLQGVAMSMVIKAAVCLAGALVESVTRDFLGGKLGGYEKRTQKLQNMGIIDEEIRCDLDWDWEVRNRQH